MNERQEFHRWLPFLTLLRKEILRFFTISAQTIVTPVMSATLYLLVFGLGLGARIDMPGPHSYLEFMLPGLLVMAAIQSSFSNSSASLFMARYLGYIVDLLVLPLRESELILAYTLASMLRALIVVALVLAVSCFFGTLPWPRPLTALGLLILCSFVFAQIGCLAAIHSESLEALAMYTNFIILPLIYLGGLFYPVGDLPGAWGAISRINPIYHLMESFRACAISPYEPQSSIAAIFLACVAAGLFLLALNSAKRLRS